MADHTPSTIPKTLKLTTTKHLFIHFTFPDKSMHPRTHTIAFNPDGTAHCLWTEAVPLQELGQLEITRATNIEFNNGQQQWEVRDPAGALLYFAPSRNACLTWEHNHFQ
jgi:hypothetical protein